MLPRPFLRFTAQELVRRLVKSGHCEFRDAGAAAEAFDAILLDEFALEESINAEARKLLEQYDDYMRANQVSYQEMFNKVKRNILAERKVVPAAARDRSGMKVSRDKVTDLSHKLATKLPRLPGARVAKGWNDTRLEIARQLTAIWTLEHQVDEKARRMIAAQKRDIVEGGQEWQVLHRNYYEKEMERMGVDLREPEAREG